jgi:hypothetical protein
MAVLGAAQCQGRRRDVAAELAAALFSRGVYRGSREELQPLRGDWRAIVLPLAATLVTLARPSACQLFTDGAVHRYALAPEGWRRLLATPALDVVSPAPA